MFSLGTRSTFRPMAHNAIYVIRATLPLALLQYIQHGSHSFGADLNYHQESNVVYVVALQNWARSQREHCIYSVVIQQMNHNSVLDDTYGPNHARINMIVASTLGSDPPRDTTGSMYVCTVFGQKLAPTKMLRCEISRVRVLRQDVTRGLLLFFSRTSTMSSHADA